MGKDKVRGEKIKELVCISGKGGTGKTSLVASFASMAETIPEGGDVESKDEEGQK